MLLFRSGERVIRDPTVFSRLGRSKPYARLGRSEHYARLGRSQSFSRIGRSQAFSRLGRSQAFSRLGRSQAFSRLGRSQAFFRLGRSQAFSRLGRSELYSMLGRLPSDILLESRSKQNKYSRLGRSDGSIVEKIVEQQTEPGRETRNMRDKSKYSRLGRSVAPLLHSEDDHSTTSNAFPKFEGKILKYFRQWAYSQSMMEYFSK